MNLSASRFKVGYTSIKCTTSQTVLHKTILLCKVRNLGTVSWSDSASDGFYGRWGGACPLQLFVCLMLHVYWNNGCESVSASYIVHSLTESTPCMPMRYDKLYSLILY